MWNVTQKTDIMAGNFTPESTSATNSTTNELLVAETTVFSTLFLAIVIFNVLALYVLYQRKTSRPSLKFTMALCLENLILGGSLLIFIITSSIHPNWIDENVVPCYTVAVIFITHILSSALIGLLISIDRFIAVRNSLRYNNWMTTRTCMLLIAVTLTVSLGIALLQLSDRNTVHYQPNLCVCITTLSPASMHWKLYIVLIAVVASVIPLLLNSYIYWSIYCATKNTTALARRNSFQPLTSVESVLKDDEDRESFQPTAKQSIRKLSGQLIVHKDNRKAAKMGIIVVLAEIFFFLPFCIIVILSVLQYMESSLYDWIVLAFLFLDCVANPIVYVLRNKSARQILTSLCKGSNYSQSLHSHRANHTQTSVFFRLIASQSSNESIQTI